MLPRKRARTSKRTIRISKATNILSKDLNTTLLSLPIEILFEILGFCTPRELLALARSSRAFCYTSVSPEHAWIWKRLRDKEEMKPPDPYDKMPEPAYASFLYDIHKCEVRRDLVLCD